MHVYDHRTSRQCDDPACRGVLEDSIINFGETLPEKELTNAFSHAEKVCVCMCVCAVYVVCVCVCVCVWCVCERLFLTSAGRLVYCTGIQSACEASLSDS